jgi:hypothetical protein
MKKRDRLMAMFWILLGVTISIWSATFPFGNWTVPGPALFPLACGLIFIVLGIIMFFQAKIKKEEVPARPFEPLVLQWPVVITFGGMFLSTMILETLGFALSMFLMILLLMRTIEPKKWKTAVIYSLTTALGSLIFFKFFLKISLPSGFLGF